MIGRLFGKVVHRDITGRVILDVHDVGYVISCTTRDADTWGRSSEPVQVWVSTDVREDAIVLFGFAEDVDRVAFERLRAVDGVGPKTALAALDTLGLAGLDKAVNTDDMRALCSIAGVGKKLASRLALELKGKLPVGLGQPVPLPVRPSDTTPSIDDDPWALALVRLGYAKGEISRAREAIAADSELADASVTDRLRAALRILSGG